MCKNPVSQETYDAVMMWFADYSVWVEQHTQSATIEVLAAKCLKGEASYSCGSFWAAIGDAARGSLFTELNNAGVGFLYDPLMNILVRNRTETVQVEKSNRDWVGQEDQRDAIIKKYQAGPWLNYVLPGIIYGQLENAGTITVIPMWKDRWGITSNLFAFDDSAVLFGPAGRAFLWLTTVGTPTGGPYTSLGGWSGYNVIDWAKEMYVGPVADHLSADLLPLDRRTWEPPLLAQ